ncbi:MAG: hypothetical protein IKH75_11755 [Ruminococcus sp.]|nr:hypothetical protein [Ruminococcus sp.]
MAKKGNTYQEKPKLKSKDMAALMAIDKAVQLNNPDSPAVNKANLKLMERQEKAQAVARNLLSLANIVDEEIGYLDRKALKNETAVDLDDVRAVMERTRDYFVACAEAGNPPSLMSYCSIGLGLTRSRVSDYCRKHHNETTDFLARVSDLIADQLTTGALYGNLDNIMAIFQLKNLHGFADNVRIEAATQEQAPEIDEDALRAEYAKFVQDGGDNV